MSHYAIVKGNRLDVEWCFYDHSKRIKRIKQKAIDYLGIDASWMYMSYEEMWKEMTEDTSVNKSQIKTGTYTEWQGEVNYRYV